MSKIYAGNLSRALSFISRFDISRYLDKILCTMIYRCHHCRKEFDFDGKPGIDELCPGCSSYIKCCANCGFYSESAHHSCLEPVTEFVSDKTGRNFCEYFRFREKTGTTPGKDINKLKSDFDKLFKK